MESSFLQVPACPSSRSRTRHLPRVPQRLGNGSFLFCQRPNNALTRRHDLGLSSEDAIAESVLSIDQLPAFAFEHLQQIVEE